MHPELIVRAISGITSPHTSIDKFMVNSMIFSKSVAKNVINYLNSIGIGSASGEVMTFSRSDRLKTAVMALQIGCDIERVSNALTWRDFEALTLEILHTFGYATEKNVRFTKPRCEIDVIGTDSTHSVVIDCKHWKRSNHSLISTYAMKQLTRTELLLERSRRSITFAIPAILTLHPESVHFINKVPIIPVNQFASFLRDFESNYQEICVVRTDQK
jgi:hypothetical protein